MLQWCSHLNWQVTWWTGCWLSLHAFNIVVDVDQNIVEHFLMEKAVDCKLLMKHVQTDYNFCLIWDHLTKAVGKCFIQRLPSNNVNQMWEQDYCTKSFHKGWRLPWFGWFSSEMVRFNTFSTALSNVSSTSKICKYERENI